MEWAPGGSSSDRIIPMINSPLNDSLTSPRRPRISAVRFSPAFNFPIGTGIGATRLNASTNTGVPRNKGVGSRLFHFRNKFTSLPSM
jgi:hypothetical protein